MKNESDIVFIMKISSIKTASKSKFMAISEKCTKKPKDPYFDP